MVHRAGVGEPYYVQLVSFDGVGGPWAQGTTRSEKTFWFPPGGCPQGGMCGSGETANYNIPETSVSATHVYFLDGETRIKSLSPSGRVADVASVNAPPNSQVAFSVSPDDTRIAISVITLATTQSASPLDVHMYAQDLGGSHRVDLYSSTTIAEWPVGWHAGHLVVAVGSPDMWSSENPYAATGYQVVDPASASRVASLSCARGLLVPAGTACAEGWCATASGPCIAGTLGKQSWDGTRTEFALPKGPPPPIFTAFDDAAELSPDGMRLAVSVVLDPLSGAVTTMLLENGEATFVAPGFAPLGWLDNHRLVVRSVTEIDIVDLNTRASKPMTNLKVIPLQGMPELMGIMPANLG